jgi:hypothetical protein
MTLENSAMKTLYLAILTLLLNFSSPIIGAEEQQMGRHLPLKRTLSMVDLNAPDQSALKRTYSLNDYKKKPNSTLERANTANTANDQAMWRKPSLKRILSRDSVARDAGQWGGHGSLKRATLSHSIEFTQPLDLAEDDNKQSLATGEVAFQRELNYFLPHLPLGARAQPVAEKVCTFSQHTSFSSLSQDVIRYILGLLDTPNRVRSALVCKNFLWNVHCLENQGPLQGRIEAERQKFIRVMARFETGDWDNLPITIVYKSLDHTQRQLLTTENISFKESIRPQAGGVHLAGGKRVIQIQPSGQFFFEHVEAHARENFYTCKRMEGCIGSVTRECDFIVPLAQMMSAFDGVCLLFSNGPEGILCKGFAGIIPKK